MPQPMGRHAQNTSELTISEWCVEGGEPGVVNEVEQEAAQDSVEENNIDSVNINSIHFNKNCSVISVNLKTSAGPNNVVVPYKVDTGSNGNIMPLHIYKNCFLNYPMSN